MDMGGHMSCYGWAWVDVDGYGMGMGMGTNSKEMLGSTKNPSILCTWNIYI